MEMFVVSPPNSTLKFPLLIKQVWKFPRSKLKFCGQLVMKAVFPLADIPPMQTAGKQLLW